MGRKAREGLNVFLRFLLKQSFSILNRATIYDNAFKFVNVKFRL